MCSAVMALDMPRYRGWDRKPMKAAADPMTPIESALMAPF